jgi:hypothetical protein
MITMESTGDFKNTESFLKRVTEADIFRMLDRYGQEGVHALASATPIDIGKTAASWSYEIQRTPGKYAIIWSNGNVNQGVPIAILIQYGHGTGTGGYVQGRDFINPALRPIFDRMMSDFWREVTK